MVQPGRSPRAGMQSVNCGRQHSMAAASSADRNIPSDNSRRLLCRSFPPSPISLHGTWLTGEGNPQQHAGGSNRGCAPGSAPRPYRLHRSSPNARRGIRPPPPQRGCDFPTLPVAISLCPVHRKGHEGYPPEQPPAPPIIEGLRFPMWD